MFSPIGGPGNPTRTTNYKVVLPFYLFAAISFFVGCILLLTSTASFNSHYFNPFVLSVTHTMALGWGTMMILGAGHQLIPVLIEGKLRSDMMGFLSFGFTSTGIVLLIWAFFHNNFDFLAEIGGCSILLGFIFFVINTVNSMIHSGNYKNVHAAFIFIGSLWMIATIAVGVILVFNFNYNFLSAGSLKYLPLHAHFGIVGWFLMLVLGVGSRLIPMFMISKYSNPKLLWIVLCSVNAGLILFTITFLNNYSYYLYFISILVLVIGIILFAKFCITAYQQRIRKKVEPQLKVSILSSIMMLIPALILIFIILISQNHEDFVKLALLYGFCIFFGWITAIIFGMTFKTLPFILWNKKFHKKALSGQTPNPKDLFSQKVFNIMLLFYFSGFITFAISIPFYWLIGLRIGATFLIIAAELYNLNVFKMVYFKN